MFSKGFILSLGLSLCAVVLVYLYVKNRITNLENKVDSLIEIIQAHQRFLNKLVERNNLKKLLYRMMKVKMRRIVVVKKKMTKKKQKNNKKRLF